MGFLDFFKKKEEAAEEREKEKIDFNDIRNLIEKRETEIRETEKEVFRKIQDKIEAFSGSLEPKLNILEKIDIDAKKEVGRTKMIVKQSLDNYIKSIHIFKKEIKELPKENIQEFIKEINKIFTKFEKTSFLFYQRANFLVGDELAAVKKETSSLSTKFKEIFDNNKKIIHDSEKINEIDTKLVELNNKEDEIKNMDSEMESLDKKLEKIKQTEEDTGEEVDKIKSSKEYEESKNTEAGIKKKEAKISTDLLRLKTLIDFKKLSHVHHSSTKDMEKIKEYKENFQKSDLGYLLKLLNEAGLKSTSIEGKIEEIKTLKEEISTDKSSIKEDPTKALDMKLKNIIFEKESITLEKEKLSKRTNLQKEAKEKIVESLKKRVESIGVIIN